MICLGMWNLSLRIGKGERGVFLLVIFVLLIFWKGYCKLHLLSSFHLYLSSQRFTPHLKASSHARRTEGSRT